MIFLATALSFEARVLIKHFHLSQTEGPLPVFSNGELTLFETGSGPLSASSLTAAALSREDIHPSDFLINIGICAGLRDQTPGSIYVIHRLRDLSSGRDYYPDLLACTISEEASLATGAEIYKGDSSFIPSSFKDGLYDMEGAAVFHAGSLFFAPHQMRFLKIVSDLGKDLPDPKTVSAWMESAIPYLEEEIEAMKLQCASKDELMLDTEDAEALFRPSKTMRRQIYQLLLYCELSRIDWRSTLERYQKNCLLPAKSREEGKKRLEEVRDELLA